MSNALKVVYLDDQQDQIDVYEPIWESILGQLSENIEFSTRSKFEPDYIEKIMPQILIVDNVIIGEDGYESDNEGAIFISKLKTKYPHIYCVLFTEATFTIETLSHIWPNPDLLVPKNPIRSTNYQSGSVVPQMKAGLTRRPIGQVRFDPISDKTEYQEHFLVVETLFEQCFNQLLAFESDLIDEITLRKLAGGVSGASVFLCEIVGIKRLKNIPLVFRFGAASDILEEVKNYKRFVALQIPHPLRVELIGFGYHGEYGGIIYAFAHGDTENTITAAKHLAELEMVDRITLLNSICKRTFLAESNGWYIKQDSDDFVTNYFSNSREYSVEKDDRRIRGIQQNINKFKIRNARINSKTLKYFNNTIKHPRDYLFSFANQIFERVICHGDLNLNNIVINNKNGSIALIDFEYSGIDHIYKDYISLECSALEFAELPDQIENEVNRRTQQYCSGEFLRSGVEVIDLVRDSFIQNCESESLEDHKRKYAFCLAFHIFKVAALPILSKAQFINLLIELTCLSNFLQKN